MTILFDNCAIQGIYGNRIWIKDVRLYSSLIPFLKMVSMWNGADKEDYSINAKSYEIDSDIWESVVTIMRNKFTFDEVDINTFFENKE